MIISSIFSPSQWYSSRVILSRICPGHTIDTTISFVQFIRQRLVNFFTTLKHLFWITVGEVASDKKDPLE